MPFYLKDVEGIMNVTPILPFPGNLCLEVRSVTRVLQPSAGDSPPPSPRETT